MRKAQTGDQMLIFFFLLLLAPIGISIGGGSYIFFGGDYDFRAAEAQTLNDQVSKCLLEKNIDFTLQGDLLKKEIYSKCSINQKVVEESLFIYIEIDKEKKFDSGKGDITQCRLADKNPAYLKCADSSFSKTINGENSLISVTTGSSRKLKKELT